ncbi:hypothetical protein BH10ACT7_BH10ACT7_06010 [soil metagenome]
MGAVSCGRCAGPIDATVRFCPSCGLLVIPAATGGIVGTYSGLLAGVHPARALLRYLAATIDAAPLVIGFIVALLLARDSAAPLLAFAGIAVAYLALQVVALTTNGRSLGRLLLGLRTVDDLTGDPVSLPRFFRQLGSRRWGRRTVTAALRKGRDPLEPARAPVAAASLAVDHDLARTPRTRSRAVAPVDAEASETVTILLDTGERYEVRGSVLVGRGPERKAGDESTLFPLPDLSRSLSKTHARLEWSGAVLWVTDLRSTNGSVLVSPTGERQPLAPGLRGAASVGWTVELGERSFEVRPGTARTV